MCLLAMIFRQRPGEPLVVAANRDEWFARPATPMQVLRESAPRVLGGRDELAGGTWLATNEHGVVAGLTNMPTPMAGRDASLRSRGELPMMLTAHATAAAAVKAFAKTVTPGDYGPCWLLAGDRNDLFYIDLTQLGVAVQRLDPGLVVLENKPLFAKSTKADRVRQALADHDQYEGAALRTRLRDVLSGHAGGLDAVCVHADPYGTRSSSVIVVGDSGLPSIRYGEGAPCKAKLEDATALWQA